MEAVCTSMMHAILFNYILQMQIICCVFNYLIMKFVLLYSIKYYVILKKKIVHWQYIKFIMFSNAWMLHKFIKFITNK